VVVDFHLHVKLTARGRRRGGRREAEALREGDWWREKGFKGIVFWGVAYSQVAPPMNKSRERTVRISGENEEGCSLPD